MFKRWYQASLRHQILIWLLVITFFVLVIMAVATLQVSRSLVEKNILEQLEREHLIESEIIEISLNRMVGEMKSFSRSSVLLNALSSPDRARQILEPFVIRNPLIQEDHDDFFLLDAHNRQIYSIGNAASWVDGSNALAKSALTQLKAHAAIFKVQNSFLLQVAQPVEDRGVVVFSQSINQLLSRFFQGRKDISAWILLGESGEILSTLHQVGVSEQKIAQELFSNRLRSETPVSSNTDSSDRAWKTIKGSLRLVPPLADLHLQLELTERINWTRIVAIQLLWPFIGVFILVSLIAVSIITLAGRRLSAPIEVLEKYARSIEQTGFTALDERQKLEALLSRHDEVGRLSMQFANMLKRLRSTYAGLEHEVAQRNVQLEAIFELSPDGFIEIDANGKVGFVNSAFEVLTSLSAKGMAGKAVSQLIEKLHEFANNLTYSQISDMFESAGQFRWLELNIPYRRALLVLTKRNRLGGRIVYLRDVTQEAELEEMRSAFMSTAAHELRTPISNILGYAELLMRRLNADKKPSEAIVQEMVSVIERQSKNMAELVNDLLDLSRLEGQMAKGLNLHETSLATYLRPVLAQFQMPGDARELVTYVDDHLPEVQLHPESFKRLIVNLLSNAFKYSAKGSPVIVKTFTQKISDKLYVGISIKDYGDGISTEDLAHVFERFYRGSSHEAITGSGLGLAIAKEIMDAHSGDIKLESELGSGTLVTLLFPATRTWGRAAESIRSH